MRVGVVFEYPTVNGGENSMFAAIEWLLADAGPSDLKLVALCPPRGAVRNRLSALNIETVVFDRHSPEEGEERPAQSSRELQIESLITAVKAARPDVLHANSLAMGRLLGAAASQLPCPTTAHLRDILKLSKAAIRDLNQNSRLVAVSKATREFHIAQGLTVENSCVVHNGIAGGGQALSNRPQLANESGGTRHSSRRQRSADRRADRSQEGTRHAGRSCPATCRRQPAIALADCRRTLLTETGEHRL